MKGPISSRKVDLDELDNITRDLNPKSLKAYLHLLRHYWERGKLPLEDHDLAAICKVTVGSLRRMKEQLGWVFETDGEGRWRDCELEEERARAMRISAANRANGRKGGQARWEPEDPEGMGWASDGAPHAPEEMANSMANAMPSAIRVAIVPGAENGLPAMAIATPSASSGGSIDRSSIEDLQTIDRSSPRADVSDAIANPMANGIAFAMPVAIVPGAEKGLSAMPIAMANGATSASGDPVVAAAKRTALVTPCAPANEAAGASPELTAPVPTNQASAALAISDADLIDRLRQACGKLVLETAFTHSGIAPIREMLAEGCDFDLDILPAISDRVRALGDYPLRTFRAKFIRGAVKERRDERIRQTDQRKQAEAAKKPSSDEPPKVFIRRDSPQFTTWSAYLATRRERSLWTFKNNEGHDVAQVSSEWPPDHVPGATTVAREAAA